jgi:signal transduction histidine kinase/CheY-like chemotaxis protein
MHPDAKSANPPSPGKATSFLRSLLACFLPTGALKRRAWILSGCTILLVGLVLSGLITFVVFRVYDRMEADWAATNLSRLEYALKTRLESMLGSVKDYSTWDDTANFITSPSTSYIEANLNEQTFTNLGLSGFLIFDPEGRLVQGRIRSNPLPTEPLVNADRQYWSDAVQKYRSRISSPKDCLTGFMEYQGRVYLFGLAPVLNNQGEGNVRGYVWQFRVFGDSYLTEIRNLTGLGVTLGEIPVTADEQRAAVGKPLLDIYGRQLAVLSATYPRLLHHFAHLSVWLVVGVMALMIIVAELTLLFLLHRLVVSRLLVMHHFIEEVRGSGTLDARLPPDGEGDELSDLSQAFNQLLDHLGESRRATRQTAAEKAQLNDKLQQAQKLEALGTMTGGLAHDFNNLLNGILCSTGMIRLELGDSARIEEHLQRIDTAGKHAAALVRKIQAFGRSQPVRIEPVHAAALVSEALHLARGSLPKSVGMHFRNEALQDLVMADATQVQQVIMNLLNNAGHALAAKQDGAIHVGITEENLPLQSCPETKALKGMFLRIEVRDNGCGIPAEVLHRIFDPYFTTKPIGTGTGLGLAVVHGIVSKHGGVVSVESTEGVGTSFSIFLPRCAEPSKPSPVAQKSGSGRSLQILVVDDDAIARDSIVQGLRHLGHSVTGIANPEAALRWIEDKSHPLDMLISDQLMPTMTGIELGERARKLRPALVMYMISGFTAAMKHGEVANKGFAGMVMKPVTLDQLQEITLRASQFQVPGVS